MSCGTLIVGCNWCGTNEVKLAENKPYCLDCASNSKRECAVCHKPYPNLKFYIKHNKRCNSCQSHYIAAKTKKASIENNCRKFSDTTTRQKQYVSDEESASSGEEKEEEDDKEDEDEYQVEDNGNNSAVEGVKKENHSNEATSKTKNVQNASTPSPKRQLTVMETLQINKMKQDREAGDKKKKKKDGKNTAEVTAEKSHFLQQVAEYISKKHGRGQLIVNF